MTFSRICLATQSSRASPWHVASNAQTPTTWTTYPVIYWMSLRNMATSSSPSNCCPTSSPLMTCLPLSPDRGRQSYKPLIMFPRLGLSIYCFIRNILTRYSTPRIQTVVTTTTYQRLRQSDSSLTTSPVSLPFCSIISYSLHLVSLFWWFLVPGVL